MIAQPEFDPTAAVASALGLPPRKVAAAVKLFADGNTVPFIARYRKEATEGLDEVALRNIAERHEYLRQIHDRKQTILASIETQGMLTAELREQVLACSTKTELEDLYLPFRPKKQTRATRARERGLGPLAERILAQPEDGRPEIEAEAFINAERGVADIGAALSGARDIVAEHLSELAPLRALARTEVTEHGVLVSEAIPEKTTKPTKFEQYYAHREPFKKTPSHRFLALLRGEKAGVLRVRVEVDEEKLRTKIAAVIGLRPEGPFAAELTTAMSDALSRLILPSVSTEARRGMKEEADRAALAVFSSNLRNVLLAAPLGAKAVVGIDPGIRTGCKCVAIDRNGKFLEEITVFPWKGTGAVSEAEATLLEFIKKHEPFAVAVGNGTGGRETEALCRKLGQDASLASIVVAVNEAGASIYSASELAGAELPNLDVTVRGSVSIARRLQDPLAELVKLDPKSIGVGQYQHDVNQTLLRRELADVVESCVNHVGVDLNTASPALLGYVAGIGPTLAKKIVEHRDTQGEYKTRAQLLEVPGLGPRAFEQAAGFLRIAGGEQCLDRSAVHPERYGLVERIAVDLGVTVETLLGDPAVADRIDRARYLSDEVGAPTLDHIIEELKRPGRDPRASFEPPKFRADVTSVADLQVGMKLEGVVTNVTAFGAFVDIGVHQDGLVHISKLGGRFVKDPSEVVKVGQRLEVSVVAVDTERKRISLTTTDAGERKPARKSKKGSKPRRGPKAGEAGNVASERPAGRPRRGPRPAAGGPDAVTPPAEGAVAVVGPDGEAPASTKPRDGGRRDRDRTGPGTRPRDGARPTGGRPPDPARGGKPPDRSRGPRPGRGSDDRRPGAAGKPGREQSREPRRDDHGKSAREENSRPRDDKPAELFNNPFAVLKKR